MKIYLLQAFSVYTTYGFLSFKNFKVPLSVICNSWNNPFTVCSSSIIYHRYVRIFKGLKYPYLLNSTHGNTPFLFALLVFIMDVSQCEKIKLQEKQSFKVCSILSKQGCRIQQSFQIGLPKLWKEKYASFKFHYFLFTILLVLEFVISVTFCFLFPHLLVWSCKIIDKGIASPSLQKKSYFW